MNMSKQSKHDADFERMIQYYNHSILMINLNDNGYKLPKKKYFMDLFTKLTKIQITNHKWDKLYQKYNTNKQRPNKYSLDLVINELNDIYNKEGLKGLTKFNLDNKHASLYSTFIKKYIKIEKFTYKTAKNSKTLIPDEYCAHLLNIIPEYNQYIKERYPFYCNNYEELLELHIKPVYKQLSEKYKINSLDYGFFEKYKYYDIIAKWKSFGKELQDIRIDLNITSCKNNYFTYDNKLLCDSQAERNFYNFIKLKCEDNTEIKHPIKYYNINPDLAISENCKNYSCDYFIINNTTNQKIYCEIWGTNDDNKNNFYKPDAKASYIKTKNNKLKFWKTFIEQNPDYIFIELNFKDCNENKLNNILQQYFTINLNQNQDIATYISQSLEDKYLNEIKEIITKYPNVNITMDQLYILSNRNITETIINNLGGTKKILKKLNYTNPKKNVRKYYSILDVNSSLTPSENEQINNLVLLARQIQNQNMIDHDNNEKYNILPHNDKLNSGLQHKINKLFGHLDKFREYLSEDVKQSNLLNQEIISQILKKTPDVSYKETWIPIGIIYIQYCNNNDIQININTWDKWILNYNKIMNINYNTTHWDNINDNNPWYIFQNSFDTFINDVYKILKQL